MKIIIVLLLLAPTLSCSKVAKKFKPIEKTTYTRVDTSLIHREILGGFRDISITSEICLFAFDFLKKELKKQYPEILLKEIQNAQKQVVAGKNIRLVCKYDQKNQKNKILSAKIFINFEKECFLTKIDFLK